jgi:hydroxyethylthiazole kinase-like sugar kinase family protein
MQQNDIHVLNVAGPRASKESEVGKFVVQVLDELMGRGGEIFDLQHNS